MDVRVDTPRFPFRSANFKAGDDPYSLEDAMQRQWKRRAEEGFELSQVVFFTQRIGGRDERRATMFFKRQ